MLILYTPLPVADTGTAVYAAALLEELLAQGGPPVRDQTIVAIDGREDASPDAIRAALKDMKPGGSLKLGVIQQGVRKEVTLTVEATK